MAYRIPLHAPWLDEAEQTAVSRCLAEGWVSTAGPRVGEFEGAMARRLGTPGAVAVASGTAALHLALRAAGVGPGDWVVMPALSFIAPANALRYLGAEPLWVDIHPETWQMDPESVAQRLAACTRTRFGLLWKGRPVRALLVVHLLGGVASLGALGELAQTYGLPLVEDAAEALGAQWQGKPAGTLGDFGCYSFNGNKILTTGGGGLVVTKDKQALEWMKHWSTQAKLPGAGYVHDTLGYNYRLSSVHAAVGIAQLEKLDAALERKARWRKVYEQRAGENLIFQKNEPGTTSNHWLTTVCTPDRDGLAAFLAAEGVETRPLWAPLPDLPLGWADRGYPLQVTQKIFQQALSLPSGPGLPESAVEEVADLIATHAVKGVNEIGL